MLLVAQLYNIAKYSNIEKKNKQQPRNTSQQLTSPSFVLGLELVEITKLLVSVIFPNPVRYVCMQECVCVSVRGLPLSLNPPNLFLCLLINAAVIMAILIPIIVTSNSPPETNSVINMFSCYYEVTPSTCVMCPSPMSTIRIAREVSQLDPADGVTKN